MALLIGFSLAPLAVWLLATRTPRTGRTVAALLTAAIALQLALGARWILDDLHFTLLIPLTYLIPAGLVVAVVAEGRKPGVQPLRHSGARGVAGLVAVSVYAALAAAALAAGALMLLVQGPPFATPTPADIMPLPAGLTVTGNSEGCGNGAFATCSASVDVRADPTAAASGATTSAASRLRDLLGARGWPLAPDAGSGTASWSGCRDEGLLLDRHRVCAAVFETDAAHASVTLEMISRW